MEETTTTIMAALATLSPPQLSDLTHTILSQTHHHLLRLSSLLSSPILFSLTLHRLNSISLPHKTLLIANHLLSSLHHLTLHFQPNPPPPRVKQRDLDSVLLLLLLCDVHQHNPEALQAPTSKWRQILSNLYSDDMLTVSGIGVYNGSALVSYIEVLTRCLRFVSVMGFCYGGKVGREVAASPAVVVALPSVEVRGGGSECVICKEEMKENRDVCELPCRHLFHWMCILRWLKKRNTCPCCRFRLPTDDVFGEIQRLLEVLVKIGNEKGLI
ncbi:PREDICTED: E3 [Prunus dulcis]|uniref:RING-type E3 ubiquitin transferase n=1 Tax=Prunus dulcis TaxID=3755 RepID=A0A5E4F5V4_PRUDU|nr:E3 ubiquitin-protein ligase SGR9, amyloplastic [Prunus dulcis]KAI5325498.1 hypothetical protein L3X38_034572 [Prunus dulcis]VVA22519.1 PREDICTED: E3 [Prunus dulcis]